MEVRLFTLFYRLTQAKNLTKTKDFHLSCKFDIFDPYTYFQFCFRFLNLLDKAKLDQALLWTHTMAVRMENRREKIYYENCKAFVSDEEREAKINLMYRRLKVSNVTEEIKSLPNHIIEEGGQMFVYLMSCPALHWQNFYHHLLFEKSNSEIILTVLNAIRNSRTKGGRVLADKIFIRLAEIFGFKYKYFANGTKWINNITTVNGKNFKAFCI